MLTLEVISLINLRAPSIIVISFAWKISNLNLDRKVIEEFQTPRQSITSNI
jgi:hypothetical protein